MERDSPEKWMYNLAYKAKQGSSAVRGTTNINLDVTIILTGNCHLRVDSWRGASRIWYAWGSWKQMEAHLSTIACQVPVHLFRSENWVQNHFYSTFRKTIRKLNKLIAENYKKELGIYKTQFYITLSKLHNNVLRVILELMNKSLKNA